MSFIKFYLSLSSRGLISLNVWWQLLHYSWHSSPINLLNINNNSLLQCLCQLLQTDMFYNNADSEPYLIISSPNIAVCTKNLVDLLYCRDTLLILRQWYWDWNLCTDCPSPLEYWMSNVIPCTFWKPSKCLVQINKRIKYLLLLQVFVFWLYLCSNYTWTC